RKKLIDRDDTGSKHKGLITVIARTPVTELKHFRHGNLCQLFSVSKNPKLSLPGQYFLPPQQTNRSTFHSKPVVINHKGLEIVITKLVADRMFALFNMGVGHN